ncbi:Uncharacterised protein [uncultured archaeon]|nr:Uncharacterised protein [uncultured archaeon]
MTSVIPKAGVSKIIGLLEFLHDFEDKKDADEIASELKLDLDDILPVIKSSEMLDLVKVDDGQIKLTDLGLKLLKQTIPERKEYFKTLILSKTILSKIIKNFGRNTVVKRHDFIKFLEKEVPEDVALHFEKIIEWGQYIELLKYDRNEDEIHIQ